MGVSLTINTPCAGISCRVFLSVVPMSLCCHRSLYFIFLPMYVHFIGKIDGLFFPVIIQFPAVFRTVHETYSQFTIIQRLCPYFFSPISINRRACSPFLSWLMAITSLLVNISMVSLSILRRSLPLMSGAANIHHMEKWVIYSSRVIPPLPTSNISASFQCPGPA